MEMSISKLVARRCIVAGCDVILDCDDGSTLTQRGSGTVSGDRIEMQLVSSSSLGGSATDFFNGTVTGEDSFELDNTGGTVTGSISGACDIVPPFRQVVTITRNAATRGILSRASASNTATSQALLGSAALTPGP